MEVQMNSFKLFISGVILTSSLQAMEVPGLANLCTRVLGNQIVEDQETNSAKIVEMLIKLKDSGISPENFLKSVQATLTNPSDLYKKILKSNCIKQELGYRQVIEVVLELISQIKNECDQIKVKSLEDFEAKKYLKNLIKEIVNIFYDIPVIKDAPQSPFQYLNGHSICPENACLQHKYANILNYLLVKDQYVIELICEEILDGDRKEISEICLQMKQVNGKYVIKKNQLLGLLANADSEATPVIPTDNNNDSNTATKLGQSLFNAYAKGNLEALKLMFQVGANINLVHPDLIIRF